MLHKGLSTQYTLHVHAPVSQSLCLVMHVPQQS